MDLNQHFYLLYLLDWKLFHCNNFPVFMNIIFHVMDATITQVIKVFLNFMKKWTLMIYFKLHWKLIMIRTTVNPGWIKFNMFHICLFVFWVVDEFLWKKLRGIVLFIGNEEQMYVMSVWGEMGICATIYYIRFFFLSFSISFWKELTTMSPAALSTDCTIFTK